MPSEPGPAFARHGLEPWSERWRCITADLSRPSRTSPPPRTVIDQLDGRMIRIAGRWLADFASSSYLGFDPDCEISDAIPGHLQRWGAYAGRSRHFGVHGLYEEIEQRLAALLRSEDVLVLPHETTGAGAVIPLLADGGTVFVERGAGGSMQRASVIAAARGTDVLPFSLSDPAMLAERLAASDPGPRLICLDGIGETGSGLPDLGGLMMLARAHDALVFIDDGRGFGVIGERDPDELCDYGRRGNSIVRHLGESYDNVLLGARFIRSGTSLLEFVALPSALKRRLVAALPPRWHSGPAPVAALATVLEGLEVNERRGDQLRLDLHRMTDLVLDAARTIGVSTSNASGYPLIEFPLPDLHHVRAAGDFLFAEGICAHLAPAASAPGSHPGFRIQLTSANTTAQVAQLIRTLRSLSERLALSTHSPEPRGAGTSRPLSRSCQSRPCGSSGSLIPCPK